MGRKKTEINLECGKRLKQLIQQYDMKAVDLAEKIHCTQQHLSYMVNGKRTITPETAAQICEVFPGTNVAWLLGLDERPTKMDVVNSIFGQSKEISECISGMFVAAARMMEYKVTYPNREEPENADISFYLEKEGSDPIPVSKAELIEMGDDMIDYAGLRLKKIIRKKYDLPNPMIRSLLYG